MKKIKYLLLCLLTIQILGVQAQVDRTIRAPGVYFPTELEMPQSMNIVSSARASSAPSGSAHASSVSLEGYLPQNEIPNSLALLGPPPDTGSVAFELDQHLATEVFPLASEARKLEAISDADLTKVVAFDPIIKLDISLKKTPNLFRLLMKSTIDASASAYITKTHYQRKRPFMYNKNYTCTPLDEPSLRKDGSYPSGHTTAGWTIALILTEIFPDKADDLLIRGKEFGISRNICNAHWHSDVIAGRLVATATVATLQGNDAFLKDLEKARQEVERLLNDPNATKMKK